ncbi:MAG: CPBP family intramembrane metalloprotease [Deltaproteobacteria bacterium]|nr:CPBP family intramembrane metalloprotease [Deltaproteobacteria bacterium]MBN2673045.1 CPBP family intramembrane metalloprotease [Deltaproteobacteria bacterium]
MNTFPPSSPFRFWHGLQGLAAALLGMFGFLLLWQLLVHMGMNIAPAHALSIQTVFISSAFALGAWLGVAKTRNAPSTTLALKSAHPVFYIAAVVGVVFAGALGDEVVSLLHRWRPTFFEMGSMNEISALMREISLPSFIVLAICISVFPALGEELMFRGLILRSFQRDMPTYFAVIYSSILFGVVHFSWLQGTAAALLGGYLAVVVLFSGSIFPAVAAHLVNNLTWSLVTRFEPEFMDDVLAEGHSWGTLAICVVAVTASILVMRRFAVGKK